VHFEHHLGIISRENASQLRSSPVILKGSLRARSGGTTTKTTATRKKAAKYGPWVTSLHDAESGRGASPLGRINVGECISGGEEEEEAREHHASRRTQTHRGEAATWPPCDARGESWSFFLGSLAPVWCTSMHLPPLPPPHRRARGRCIHTWYVRARGMRGNWRLLSSGNLAPGKLHRDDGSPHSKRVHGHAQRQNSTFWRWNVTGMKGAVHSVVCSQTKWKKREN